MRAGESSDVDDVTDVYLSALSGMTYLPQLYTDAETKDFIGMCSSPTMRSGSRGTVAWSASLASGTGFSASMGASGKSEPGSGYGVAERGDG